MFLKTTSTSCSCTYCFVHKIHKYLNTYAAVGGAHLDARRLSKANRLFAEAVSIRNGSAEVEAISAFKTYLSSAAELAREQWTQFHDVPIAIGVLILTGCLIFQAWLAWWVCDGHLLALCRLPSRPARCELL